MCENCICINLNIAMLSNLHVYILWFPCIKQNPGGFGDKINSLIIYHLLCRNPFWSTQTIKGFIKGLRWDEVAGEAGVWLNRLRHFLVRLLVLFSEPFQWQTPGLLAHARTSWGKRLAWPWYIQGLYKMIKIGNMNLHSLLLPINTLLIYLS